ncbi:hypothetical protein MTBPR1_90082 [Candidatus Terasakiella magnetica]|uniref:Transposase n=1 Tax=Candidatus Terasakiella magnetica TaxID=1867952 RepID=A0A1C3RLS6_9PROT|nr:hypothetical protein [Candidatus Terasakiella magnetica]SCA58235.1 hypothetical protein MTBPR1_90082 [Candidatus Terasakiella magnetica]
MTHYMQRTYRNRDYQADFAQRLVKAVGFDDAIRECYENQWLGTLIHIQHLQRAYYTS